MGFLALVGIVITHFFERRRRSRPSPTHQCIRIISCEFVHDPPTNDPTDTPETIVPIKRLTKYLKPLIGTSITSSGCTWGSAAFPSITELRSTAIVSILSEAWRRLMVTAE